VNNDLQALRKTGIVFQDEQFRMKIISSLKVIDRVILAIDQDDSVCNSIRSIVDIAKREYGNDVKFIF
jgi:glycerol-3-phosphate cytidylyltransferase-like family protein